MKALKILILVCFTALFVVFGVLLQLDNAANGTLFSDKYFNRVFNGSVQPQNIDKLIDDATGEAYALLPLSEVDKAALQSGKASASVKKKADDITKLLRDSLDKKWLETEAPKLLQGGYAYFTMNGDKLPAFDIKPLKSALVSVYAAQIATGGQGTADQYSQMIDQVDSSSGGIMVKGKLNGKATTSFMQMMALTGMSVSKSTAESILAHAATRKADGSDKDEQFQFAVKALMNDKLGMGKMKDTLDLDLLVKNLYGSEDNPVSGLRELIGGIRSSLFLLLAVITVLLLAIIAVIAFSPKAIFRWSGAALIASGALCLIPPALCLILNGAIQLQVVHLLGQGGLDLSFLQNWAFSYINGIAIYLFVQSLIVIAVGVAFLVCAGYLGDSAEARHTASRNASPGGGVMAVRIVSVIVLVAAIPISAYFFGKGITRQAEKYDNIIQQSQTQKAPNLAKALDKTLGTDLFEGTK